MNDAGFHIHSTFSDGKDTPERLVQKAIELNFAAIGISDHAPVPFNTSWNMPLGDIQRYVSLLNNLKSKYGRSIEVYTGLEIDYIPDVSSPEDRRYDVLRLDYKIGSVHCCGRLKSGKYWMVDGKGDFEAGFQELYGGSIERLVKSYYSRLRDLIETRSVDIIAHLDLVKKYAHPWLDESEGWYRDQVFRIIEALKRSRSVIEINSAGIYRAGLDQPFPSEWIISECSRAGVPIVLSSDSHTAAQLENGFGKIAEIAKRAGYSKARTLRGGGWVEVGLGL